MQAFSKTINQPNFSIGSAYINAQSYLGFHQISRSDTTIS